MIEQLLPLREGHMGELEFGNVTVSEVMNPECPVVEKTASLCKVARLLRRYSHVWVVEEKGSPVLLGIVTEKDFLELLNPLPDRMYTTGFIRTKSLYHGEMSTAEEFMVSPVISCSPKNTVAEALEKLWERRIRHLAVVEGDRLVGELSMKGIIAAYYIDSCSMLDGS
ncbi:MAG: CBS domain-containing protein [Dehalococcoidia bacterium]|nr:MAG: CBS domain-containing protein [Dehalococcoidia bacterium]